MTTACMESLKDAGLPADYGDTYAALYKKQIMQALKMHKGVNELRLLSNTLTYQSCVLFLHKVRVCARQRVILEIRKFV